MSPTPDVSIVIPTHNRMGLLQRTVAIALGQEGPSVEVIVVDDGSTDDTAAWLADVTDPRLRVVPHGHALGVSRARNEGIRAAAGRWVALLDDDDLWHPRKIARQVSALGAQEAGWGFSSALHFLPEHRLWRRDPAPAPDVAVRRLPDDNVVPAGASNVIVSRDLLHDVGLFATDLAQLADWDMWLKLLRTGPPASVPDYDVAYRLHRRNMALQAEEGILQEAGIIDERYADLRGGPLDLVPVHRWLATSNWRNGNRAAARRHWRASFAHGDRRAAIRLLRSLIPITRLRPAARKGYGDWPEGSREWVMAADDPARFGAG